MTQKKPKNNVYILGTILLLIVVIIFIGRGDRSSTLLEDGNEPSVLVEAPVVSGEFRKGSPFPEVVFSDLDGNKHSLSEYEGKPILIDFWAKWCPFCTEEMPELQKAHEKYGDQLVLIGMHRTETESIEVAREFTKELGITYLLGSDLDGSLYKSANGFGNPVAIFIDVDGIVTEIKSGPKTPDEIASKLESLLK